MKPRLFAEIPAGLASVSLRLHGGPKCRPPISRQGNKAGYAEVILGALGLNSGSGAGAYLWVEALTVWTALGLWMVGEGPSPLTPKEPTCP